MMHRAARSLHLARLAGIFFAASCATLPRDVPELPPAVSDERAGRSGRVPVGTELTIALVDELDTARSVERETFRAMLLSDLTAVDGRVVVRAGTPLEGVIARARSGGAGGDPVLALDFGSVATATGARASLSTKLKDADAPTEHDVVLSRTRPAGATAYPGGSDYLDAARNEIHVPPGGRLRLVLTRPLSSF